MAAPKNNVAEGKARMSLIPIDILAKYVTPAYEEGLLKYERESWRLGFNTSVLFDAAQRHQEAFFYQGEDFDKDAAKLGITKHHLAGAIFSLLSILHSLENYPELDDRPCKLLKKKTKDSKPKMLPRKSSWISRRLPSSIVKGISFIIGALKQGRT